MGNLRFFLLSLVVFSLFYASCGDNTSEAENGGDQVQGGLKALSVNESAVRFQWTAVQGVPDSAVLGYLLSWPGGTDSLPRATLSYLVDSLPPAELAFTVRARLAAGGTGPAGTIRWAPAARFDTPVSLSEYYAQEPARLAGLDLGGSASDPASIAVDANNPAVGQTLDIYLFGGEGEVGQPLALRSANLLVGTWNATLFSTVTHSSASLDLPLERFPDAQTFTQNSVQIAENTIVYARVVGNQGGAHYARIQIGAATGSGRARSVVFRLSLQRVPGLPYAVRRPAPESPAGTLHGATTAIPGNAPDIG